MGTEPIQPLLIKTSIPMVISMMVQALYNIIDSLFVARIEEDALTAVSLAFSMQNLMIAIAIGTGVGFSALVSKSLGERNFEMANYAANNAIPLYAITYLLSGFYPELVKTQGAAARLDDFILFNLIFLVLLMIVRNLLPSDFTPVLFLMIYLPWMVYRGTDNLFVKKEKVPRFVVISSALLLGLPMVLKLILDLFIIK